MLQIPRTPRLSIMGAAVRERFVASSCPRCPTLKAGGRVFFLFYDGAGASDGGGGLVVAVVAVAAVVALVHR